MRLIAFFLLITFWVSGCWSKIDEQKISIVPKKQNQQERIVWIEKVSTIPCLENCTTTHIWYARAQYEDLFRTVRHVLPQDLDKIVITWTWACWLKHIWNHPSQDLTLIQTVWVCVPWISKGLIATWTNTTWRLYSNNTEQSVTFEKKEWLLFISWLVLAPGMSGSPLLSDQGALIWLVHAQTEHWTSFIDVTEWWRDLFSLSEK